MIHLKQCGVALTLIVTITTACAEQAAPSCQLNENFAATSRQSYDCKTGQTAATASLTNELCNVKGNSQTGVSGAEFTVNNDMYSVFCNNGSSYLVNCLNGDFSKSYKTIDGKKTLVKITCQNNP